MSTDTRSNEEFADYLERVGGDYAESGHEATAEDYAEAARRIRSSSKQEPRTEERAQLLADVIVGAVEGGTGYWAQVSAYKHEAPALTYATLQETEEPYRVFTLTPDAVEEAAGKLIDGTVGVNSRIRGYIADGFARNDGGDVDSDCADVIAQVAMLGEIVYG